MKKLILSISVLFLVGMVSMRTGVSQNLLSNPGFESWSLNGPGGPPDDWSLSDEDIFATQAAPPVRSGSYSVCITSNTTTSRWLQQTGIPVTGDDEYTYSFWALDYDPDGRARAVVRWFDESGTLIASWFGTYTIDSNDWQYVAQNLMAPPNAVTASVAVRVYKQDGGSGTNAVIFIDDAQFINISALVVPENRSVDDITLGMDDEECFDATNNITITSTTIGNGASVEFRAGVSINFSGGFIAASGSNVIAMITTVYCSLPKSMLASEDLFLVEAAPLLYDGSLCKIYPNPSTDIINLEFNSSNISSKVMAEIYSLMGKRLLQHETVSVGTYRIDISALPAGVYIIRIIADGKAETQKIIRH